MNVPPGNSNKYKQTYKLEKRRIMFSSVSKVIIDKYLYRLYRAINGGDYKKAVDIVNEAVDMLEATVSLDDPMMTENYIVKLLTCGTSIRKFGDADYAHRLVHDMHYQLNYSN